MVNFKEFLMRYLGITELTKEGQKLSLKYIFISSSFSVFFLISVTFQILFILSIVDFTQLGLLLALSYIVQAATDYPTGILGDKIGHRWVLFFAWIFFSVSYTFLFLATEINYLIIAFVFFGLGMAQQSGALSAWFDNNYKFIAGDHDKDREIYKIFAGKSNVINIILTGSVYIIGGVFATIIERKFVFQIQTVGFIFLAIMSLILVRDHPELIEQSKIQNESYFKMTLDGFRIIFFQKMLFYLYIGWQLTAFMYLVWDDLIKVPLYFGITGSDAINGFFRTILMIFGIFISNFAANVSKGLNSTKWLPRINTFYAVWHFGGLFFLLGIFSIEAPQLQLSALILYIFIFIISYLMFSIGQILVQSIFLDAIPDSNRNSVYSLLTSTGLLLATFFILVFGMIIEILGIQNTMIIMSLLGVSGAFFYQISFNNMKNKQKSM